MDFFDLTKFLFLQFGMEKIWMKINLTMTDIIGLSLCFYCVVLWTAHKTFSFLKTVSKKLSDKSKYPYNCLLDNFTVEKINLKASTFIPIILAIVSKII